MTLQEPSRHPWTKSRAPILIIGPAYAGKSELAMQMLAPDRDAIVVGSAPADEPAFARRLEQLKLLRPPHWECLDAGSDLVAATLEAAKRSTQVLVDAVSQWLATILVNNGLGTTDTPLSPSSAGGADSGESRLSAHLTTQISELLQVINNHPRVRFVLVSSEVGGGPAPTRSLERLYRQQVGLANQRLARLAASVISVQAGIGSVIKG